ncbi:MAG: hypothetical protein KGZ83_04330 [Sulfuricella sp.]|nr:hypothetical protein [Sulfuricella sp.]
MKEKWRKLSERIDALALRERGLVFLMMAVVLITPVNLFLIDPLRTKQKALSAQLNERYGQLDALQKKLQGMAISNQIDPNVEIRKKIQDLKHKLAESEVPLESIQKTLVSPEKKAALLEDLLLQNPRLRLITLKTLPAATALENRPVSGRKAGVPGQETSLVYRHGVQMTIEGGYHDLLQYLALLEKLPWKVVWGEADFRVEDYPRVVLTLTLYTLSLERVWLSV